MRENDCTPFRAALALFVMTAPALASALAALLLGEA